MNLRAKTLLIAVLTFAVVFAAVSIALDRVVNRAFLRLEEEEIQQKVQQVHSVILNEITDLTNLTQDWAEWDDTYTFIQNKNQGYIESNLTDASFANNRLNLVFYIDTAGETVFSKAYSLSENQEIAIPQGFTEHLSSGSPFLNVSNDDGMKGVLLLPDMPLLIASHPILQSDGIGPAPGVLILGRFLGDYEVTRLSGLTHVSFRIYAAGAPEKSPDVEAAVQTLKEEPGVFVKPLSSFSTAGYRLYNDVYGELAFALRVTTPRTIYVQGESAVYFFRMTLIIIGLLSGVLVLTSSEQMVVSRILRLSDSVGRVGTTAGPKPNVLIPGKDEVSKLAAAIDNMLGRLETSAKLLKESEERFRLLAEHAQDVIYRAELRPVLKFEYVSPSAVAMTGYSPEEFYADPDTLMKIVHPEDRERWRSLLQSPEYLIELFVLRWVHKDGKVMWTEQRNTPIFDGNGNFVAVEGIIRDITQRREAEDELRLRAQLLDSTNDFIYLRNLRGEFLYVNEIGSKLYRYSKDELMKLNGRDIIAPHLLNNYDNRVKQILDRGEARFETQHRRKDGTLFDVEVSARVIKTEGDTLILSIIRDITERKKAEQEIRTSEEKFRTLVENAPIGIAISTVYGRAVLRNRALQEMYGYESMEEFVKSPALERYHNPGDREKVVAATLTSEGRPMSFELQMRRRDGAPFWGFLTTIPWVNEQGEQCIITVIQDITERKMVEQEVRTSEEKFRTLVENAPIGIAIVDRQGNPILRNRYLQEMYGYSSNKEMEKVPVSEHYYDANDRKRYFALIGEGRVRDFEVRLKRKDGTLVWASLNSIPQIPGLEGEVITIVQDITERKKSEDELQRRAELLDSATDSIILRELVGKGPGKPVYVNRATYETRGYTREEFMAMSIQDYNTPESAKLVERRVKELLEKGEATYEAEQRRKDGSTMIVEIHSKVVSFDDKKYILSVLRDITQRKAAEQKLQELFENEKNLRQRLEEEIKNRAEYTRALVHELKTPLTPIVASSDLLVEELKEEPYRSLALNVSRGADNLNRRINELLDLARGEIGALKINPMPMDPNRLLEEIAESSRPIAGSADQTFELEVPTRLPDIIADEDRLRQILLNLIENALKYTPSGGRITVKAAVKDSSVVFEIKDTGPGISDKEKDLLFQPYYRLERDRERVGGIGLGLFLSKTLVELHEGRIWVDSKPGEGSNFAFSIPLRNIKDWVDSFQGGSP